MLTSAQVVNVRRYAGYPVAGVASATQDEVPVQTAGVITTLDEWLANLSSAEEAVLVDMYLDRLETLETDVLKAGDNVDTAEAGPWKANPRELAQRERLFNTWRRKMCQFIGVAPGPGLGAGGLAIVRA